MDVNAAFAALGIALGLGLLVGIQRERADSALAGVRTFPLITILGVVCAMLSQSVGTWVLPAGLLGVAAATAMGNRMRPATQASPGITTEIAILLMFAVGALLWVAPHPIGVAVGAACAVLLHLKTRLHGLVAKLSETDLRAIMQFALITLVVLPVLPDRTFGPLDVLNPRQIWWMVVLVVGLSLAGYVAYKLLPKSAGVFVAGVLGGLISSTATTVSFSRGARNNPASVPSAALAITLASTVVYIRVLAEIAVVAAPSFWRLAPPLAPMLLASIAGAAVLYVRSRGEADRGSGPTNPTELKSALGFAALYALVLLFVTGAQRYVGPGGLYAVAGLSGLTEMDAITLSTSRLAAAAQVEHSTAWRAIAMASMSNLVFKAGIAYALGGAALFRRLLLPFGLILVAGLGGVLLWPA